MQERRRDALCSGFSYLITQKPTKFYSKAVLYYTVRPLRKDEIKKERETVLFLYFPSFLYPHFYVLLQPLPLPLHPPKPLAPLRTGRALCVQYSISSKTKTQKPKTKKKLKKRIQYKKWGYFCKKQNKKGYI